MHGVTAARFPRDFTPLQIPNIAVWLRADLGATISSGKITRWKNQVPGGDAYDATAPAAGPVYSDNGGLNGTAHVVFDSSALLHWGYSKTSGPKTIVVVIRLDTLNGSGHTVYAIGDGVSASEMIVDLNTYQMTSYIDNQTGVGAMVGHNDALGTTSGHVLLHTYDGSGTATTDYTASMTGVTKTVSSSGAYASTQLSTLGFRRDASLAFLGKISEIIVIERVCDQVEQDQLIAYCRKRYAL